MSSPAGVLTNFENADAALAVAGVCLWEWNAKQDKLRWAGTTDPFCDQGAPPQRLADLRLLVSAEERSQFDEALNAHLTRSGNARLDVSVQSSARVPIRIRITGCAVWNDEGAALSMCGCVQCLPDARSALGTDSSVSRFQTLVDHAPVCVHEIDLNGKIVSMNRAGLRMIGLEENSQVAGVSFADCASEADRPRVTAMLAEAFAGQSPSFEFRGAASKPRTFAASLAPLRNAVGEVSGLMGITSDITEEREARELLKQNEERYQLAERVARVGIWEWELATDRVFLTNETKRMLSLPQDKDSYSIHSLINRIDAAHRITWRESVKHCLEKGSEHQIEFRVIRADGAVAWISTLADARRDEDGEPTHLLGVMTEITDRKRGEIALRESERRFQLAIQGSTDGIWDWNIESGQVFYSARYRELLGYASTDPFASDWAAFTASLHPNDVERTEEAVQDHLEHRGIFDSEFRLQTKRGAYRWFRSRGQAVWSRDGRPTRMAGSIQDITAKREAQRLLREVVDHVPHEIYAKDASGRFVMSNRKHAVDLGLTPETVVGKIQTDITPDPTQAAAFLADDQEVIRTGLPKLIPEEAFTTSHGDQIVLQTHKIPLALSSGDAVVDGVLGVSIDITHLKQTEEQLREREEQYRALVENTSDWVWEMNAEGVHTYGNGQVVEILGYTDDEFRSMRLFDLCHEDERHSIVAMVHRAMAERSGWRNFVLRLRNRSGEYRYLESSAAPVINSRGDVIGFRGIDRDITDRKRVEEEREKLIRELEEKNSELELFTYTVSHDLKSPLITIKGFLGLLERDLAKPDLQRVPSRMERIRKASNQMSQLLDELLQLSRIGRLTNQREAVSLSEVAADAVELADGLIVEYGVRVSISPNLPTVVVDRKRFLDVFLNLIGNACRFSQPDCSPTVEINVRIDDGETVLYVQDNGIGIHSDYQEKVLGLFEQLNPERGGTGIGLAIVKRIIEVHKGRVWIESGGLNTGTTVCFTIGEGQA